MGGLKAFARSFYKLSLKERDRPFSIKKAIAAAVQASERAGSC